MYKTDISKIRERGYLYLEGEDAREISGKSQQEPRNQNYVVTNTYPGARSSVRIVRIVLPLVQSGGGDYGAA